MSYRKFSPLFFLFAFVVILPALAQRRDTISINNLVQKAVKYTNDFPTEKVYVHFDKPYYSAGDTIYFKAYVTVDQHVPTVISKVVYVDVFNNTDSTMAKLRLPVVNGTAAGSLVLPPEQYKQGNYRLRAYTNWMLNFDAAYLFTKIITVGNPVDKDVYTQVSYGLPQNAQTGATVKVQFKEKSGVPYADKKVSWRVEASHEETAKGRATTDAKGFAVITLPPSSPLALSSSTLFTDIDLGNQKHAGNTFSLKAASPGKDVQFFPEGGDLVVGIASKVAVKAVKSDGLGIEYKGTVTDNEGKQVVSFESQHLGMGAFTLQPEAGKTYKVAINFADGSTGNYNLPRIQTNGITLSLSNSDPETLGLRIAANDAYFQANPNKSIYIVAQTGGFIKYAAQTTLQKQIYSVGIPKSKFSSGILQVTLSGDNGIPICERLVFIKRDDFLKISATPDKPQYARRGSVKLNIAAKNGAAPAEANLSVAVIDERKIPVDEDAETTILSSLLLTSDLKGYIEKPNYYFKNNDEKAAANLDVLMMTQGYRRFSYRDVIAGRAPKITVLPEQGIVISGTLRDKTGLPQFKKNVTLQVSDKNFVTSTTTNADGQFRFENVMLNDSSKVTVSARNNPNANGLMLMMDGSFTPAATRIINLPDERQNIDSAMAPYLENTRRLYENSRILREVVVKGASPVKKPSHLDQASLTGLNPVADHVIDGARFKGCNFFVSCLQASALGVTYVDNNFYVTRTYNQGNRAVMAVYVDGLQVDQNFIASIQSAEVESVEVFFNDGLSGINRRDGTNGVLVINKKKAPKGTKVTLDQLRELIPPPYIVSFVPGGYSSAKEFYMPKYVPGKPSSIGIDLRSTIYWNPKVITDKVTGATSLQYFNADGTGSYRAVVEGVDKDGNIGRQVIRYKVQ